MPNRAPARAAGRFVAAAPPAPPAVAEPDGDPDPAVGTAAGGPWAAAIRTPDPRVSFAENDTSAPAAPTRRPASPAGARRRRRPRRGPAP